MKVSQAWLSLFTPFTIPTHAHTLTTPMEEWFSADTLIHRNAFHIFNAIHSATRQWGSSLNHNGMSFFPAVVPAGTLLYHGSKHKTPVTGMQWLAFEPEHAQQFADGIFSPPQISSKKESVSSTEAKQKQQTLKRPQYVDRTTPVQKTISKPGFLHTYVTKRPLRLVYIDGMSGAKALNGTLDSQDFILLNETNPPAFWEYERGRGLCDIARTDWQGRVDGFLRMESGFEVLLCEFEGSVVMRDVARSGGRCAGCPAHFSSTKGLKYLRAVADRFQGIGGGRVKVNYERMVSAYSLETDLFAPGDRFPRLKSVSESDLHAMKTRVDEMILRQPNPFVDTGIDWQAVADMIVTRYSSRLKYLSLPGIIDNERLLDAELNDLLSIFIDYDNRSFVDEHLRCAAHLFPATAYDLPGSMLPKTVINWIINYICFGLVSTQHGEVSGSLPAKQKIIKDMIVKLDWTTWKECGPCGVDEICSIPLWPFGSEEDWVKPRCRNASTLLVQRGYWGKKRPWD